MKTILLPFRDELIKYCKINGLSYEKILRSPICGNEDILFVQHIDSQRKPTGLLDETPAEVLLRVEKIDNKIYFTEGENMKKYLV